MFGTLGESDKQAFNRLHDDFYYNRHNQFWADEAMRKIPIVTQSRDAETPSLTLYPLNGEGMLPCAEDLGIGLLGYMCDTVHTAVLNRGKEGDRRLPPAEGLYEKYRKWGILSADEARGGWQPYQTGWQLPLHSP